MITNRRVFDEGFVPDALAHRDGERSELVRAFEPALEGRPATAVLVHGPSGVGKTALARHTLDRLQQRAAVATGFVECMGRTTGGVLRAVLDDLGADVASNAPVADLDVRLREYVDGPAIVVLDEADGLPGLEALATIVDVDALTAVPVCHDADDWLARCDGTVRRRFAGHELQLSRYHVDELTDILEERARQGLRPGIVDRDQLEAIADRVAGVARFGIQSLRAAAEIADERDHRAIRRPDVRDSFERARRRIRAANLDSLPFHHHVLYEVVRESGGLSGIDLQDRYGEIADAVYHGRDRTPIGERARRKKLKKLRAYDLIDWEGDGAARQYWACDETLSSSIDVAHVPKK